MSVNPAAIVDRLAARLAMVTPVTSAFPLSREFCEQAIAEALAEAWAEWERRGAALPGCEPKEVK